MAQRIKDACEASKLLQTEELTEKTMQRLALVAQTGKTVDMTWHEAGLIARSRSKVPVFQPLINQAKRKRTKRFVLMFALCSLPILTILYLFFGWQTVMRDESQYGRHLIVVQGHPWLPWKPFIAETSIDNANHVSATGFMVGISNMAKALSYNQDSNTRTQSLKLISAQNSEQLSHIIQKNKDHSALSELLKIVKNGSVQDIKNSAKAIGELGNSDPIVIKILWHQLTRPFSWHGSQEIYESVTNALENLAEVNNDVFEMMMNEVRERYYLYPSNNYIEKSLVSLACKDPKKKKILISKGLPDEYSGDLIQLKSKKFQYTCDATDYNIKPLLRQGVNRSILLNELIKSLHEIHGKTVLYETYNPIIKIGQIGIKNKIVVNELLTYMNYDYNQFDNGETTIAGYAARSLAELGVKDRTVIKALKKMLKSPISYGDAQYALGQLSFEKKAWPEQLKTESLWGQYPDARYSSWREGFSRGLVASLETGKLPCDIVQKQLVLMKHDPDPIKVDFALQTLQSIHNDKDIDCTKNSASQGDEAN